MKFSKNIIYLFVILNMTPLFSHGFAELRLTYGGLGTKDFATDACGSLCTTALPGVLPLVGLGADVIISPPLTSYGFGLRYEKIGLTGSAGSLSVDAKVERIAALINYRIIDTIIHFGPIFSFGVSTQSSLSITNSGSDLVNYKSSISDSASAGIELSVKPLIIIPIIVGAEAGYEYLKIKNAHDNINNKDLDLDLSGVYLKVLLGLAF